MSDTYFYIFIVIIKCLVAILMSILGGNGAVFVFNKIPAKWLCNYGEKPSDELLDMGKQRIGGGKWRFVFSMILLVFSIRLIMIDWILYIGAFAVMWLLIEMSIADIKYGIIPDQFIILVFVSALGFIQYNYSWKHMVIGGILGGALVIFMAIIGFLAFRKQVIGGGDLKLFVAMGFILGPMGVLLLFVMSSLLSGIHGVYGLIRGNLNRNQQIPLVPYIAVSTFIYFMAQLSDFVRISFLENI